MDYGFFVNFNNSMVDWVNAKSYSLVDSKQGRRRAPLWKTRAAPIVRSPRRKPRWSRLTRSWRTAASSSPRPTSIRPAIGPRAAFGPQDAITQTHVISRTDTLFGVMARVPLSMSLIAPDGVEITPVNYAAVPTYTVMYNELYTYTLSARRLRRWRAGASSRPPPIPRCSAWI
jgi:hypothetical protein